MRFYTNQHPFYCGIDLHARTMYVCIVKHDGEIMLHCTMKRRGARPVGRAMRVPGGRCPTPRPRRRERACHTGWRSRCGCAGRAWPAAGAGQVAAATGALCPLARWPRGCGGVTRPCRHRADRSRCLCRRSGPAQGEALPTAETARRAAGSRATRRCLPRQHAFCRRA